MSGAGGSDDDVREDQMIRQVLKRDLLAAKASGQGRGFGWVSIADQEPPGFEAGEILRRTREAILPAPTQRTVLSWK